MRTFRNLHPFGSVLTALGFRYIEVAFFRTWGFDHRQFLFAKESVPMKALPLLMLLTILTAACAKPEKVDFNPEANFDQPAPSPGQSPVPVVNPGTKELNCGSTFSASFTNTDSTVGTLEVLNRGVCDVKVLATEPAGGVMGAVSTVAEFDVSPGTGNVTAFILNANQKLDLTFTCVPSSKEGKCKFGYRLSTGKESMTPSRESPPAEDSTDLLPTPARPTGNTCETAAGGEAIGRVFSNRTGLKMKVDYKAKSNCECAPFTIFSDPAGPGNKDASAGINAEATGVAMVPAGQSITLKAKCGTQVARPPCKGLIKDIKVSLSK
jgi:hypothetical protein